VRSVSRPSGSIPAGIGPRRETSAGSIWMASWTFCSSHPKRMRVRGFPEMLAKRKPTLVAIDEHTASRNGPRFPAGLSNAGAVCTGVSSSTGDRSDSDRHPDGAAGTSQGSSTLLAEAVHQRLPPRQPRDRDRHVTGCGTVRYRADSAPARRARPAIVYTPTRRDAESLSAQLSSHFRAEPYHAGSMQSAATVYRPSSWRVSST